MLLEHWASSRENWCWTGVLSPLLHPGSKECGRGLEDHFLIGWGPYTGLVKSKINNLSLCGVGEETGYTIQKDMKSINSYKTREGRTKRSVFSVPAFQDSPWFYLLFWPWVTTFSNESVIGIRWAKYWRFSLHISAFNDYSGMSSLIIYVLNFCCSRDSQESSRTLQFKSIKSLVLSFLYEPSLTSIHDYWKNHSFDEMDICQQSNISAF